MSRRDDEILAIERIMAILTHLAPVRRTRVLLYVVSRVECLGMPEAAPEKPVDTADMFTGANEPAERRVPRMATP